MITELLKKIGLFLVLCQGGWAQVPHVEPNYALNIKEWWDIHPFNPEGKHYQPKIVSPEPVIEVKAGQSINLAIQKLPSAGGTLRLAPGHYKSFMILGRSNIHILGGGAAIINGTCTISVTEEWARYGHRLNNGDLKYISVNQIRMDSTYKNPPTNILIHGLIFDGGNRMDKALNMVYGRDILVDQCNFKNYSLKIDHSNHRQNVIRGTDLINYCTRKCIFDNPGYREIGVFNSCFGCGYIECFSHYEGTIIFNKDYLVIYNNKYNPRIRNYILSFHGSHVYISKNTISKKIGTLVRSTLGPDNQFQDIYIANNQIPQITDSILTFHVLDSFRGEKDSIEKSVIINEANSANIKKINWVVQNTSK